MIVTIHQPEHLPWLGYFHKMALADLYVLLDCTQYRHRYFQNRNRIAGPQGETWVTVPVRKLEHRYGLIQDVRIEESFPWRERYRGIVHGVYRKHPYFAKYAAELQDILESPGDSLAGLNYRFITFFRRELGIHTPLLLASSLAPQGQKSDLILSIARKTGAAVYLSGPSGRDYLDAASFRQAGIGLRFHDFRHPEYAQHRRTAFLPYMSALDLLLNHGPDSRHILGLDRVEAARERLAAA